MNGKDAIDCNRHRETKGTRYDSRQDNDVIFVILFSSLPAVDHDAASSEREWTMML